MFSDYQLDLGVIAAYLLILIGLGVALKKLTSDTSDYFRAGCKSTWWLTGTSIFLSQLSAWTFTGAAGAAFEAGWSILLIFIGGPIAMFLQYLFLARWFRQLRATTVPEVLRERFGPGTQQFFAVLQIFSTVLVGAITLYGVSIFISSMFHINIHLSIIIIGLVVLIYSTIGGNWAVMATDCLQGVIIFSIACVLAVNALHLAGGLDGFFQHLKEADLTHAYRLFKEPGEFINNKYTVGWALALLLLTFTNAFSMINSVRYFGVKDGREASRAALLACVLSTFGLCIWFIPPMVARLFFMDDVMAAPLSHPIESAYAVVSMKLLPAGMTGLMAVAMISATMSSMDTALNRNAAVLVKDILPALFRAGKLTLPTDRVLLVVSQVLTFILGLILILLALMMSGQRKFGVFDIMQAFTSLIALPIAIPLALGVFIKKTPHWAALFSIVLGMISSCICYAGDKLFGAPINFQTATAVNASVCIAAFFLSCLFHRYRTDTYVRQVDGFFEKMHRPVDFEKEVGNANDSTQLRLIGLFVSGTGLLFLPLMFIADGTVRVLSVLGFSAIMILIGSGMLLAARFRK